MKISGPKIAGAVIGAVVIVAVLAVSVVTLVKVYNLDDNKTNINSSSSAASLNIYSRPVSNTKAYQDAAKYFLNSIDISVNPCDDFYQYACGKYQDSISFSVTDDANYHIMADGFNNPDPNDPYPVKQVKTMYAQCLSDQKNWSNLVGNGSIIKSVIDAFKSKTNFGFPLFDGSNAAWPDSTGLARALGYLSGSAGIETLISAYVDTNWKNPSGQMPYLLYIDQSVLSYPWTYYIGKTWEMTKTNLYTRIQDLFQGYSKILNITLNNTTLDQDIKSILDFEYLLANNYSSTDSARLQTARSYNLITPPDFASAYSNIDIATYLKELTVYNPSVTPVVGMSTFTFSLAEKDRLAQINNAVKNSFNGVVTARTFYNYLNYRLLLANGGYYPVVPAPNSFLDRYQFFRPTHGRPKFIRSRKPRHFDKADNDTVILDCVDDTVFYLQYANARVFIDKIYPTNDSRVAIRANVRKVVEGILIGMQSMIDQLNWMTANSKQGAYQKIQNLIRNYAFPDFITDNDQLTQYYNGLQDFTNKNYYQIMTLIQQFNTKTTYGQLLKQKIARDDWNGPPGTVNAWYQPELNSITFPAAILQQPFFDPEWPASINYGAMGVIAGHELTHSFDSSGTQWDGHGVLFKWLDDSSQMSFNKMAECVIQEYDNFCPLNSSYSPRCINGEQTQGENVADNGGIHSAYRAYRNSINFLGSDPLLPGDLVSSLTHDQLFFLSFAQVWCQLPPSAERIYNQLLVDPHSPSKYRVFGTVQNYPGFRNAFNCPAGATYAPEKYCNVWISDINITNTNSGSGSVNYLNIPSPSVPKQTDTQYTKYTEAQQFFMNSVNFTADPCNDFYNYACGNYKNPLSFTVYRKKNYDLMASEFEKIITSGGTTTLNGSTAIDKTVTFYSACKMITSNLTTYIKDGKVVKSIIDEFTAYTGLNFNWFDNTSNNKPLNDETLTKAIAFLSVKYGIDTFVTPIVDVNPVNDKNFFGFVLYFDQSTFFYANSYYLNGTWNITYPTYKANAYKLLTNYGKSIGATINPQINKTIDDMLEFERTIANDPYVSDEASRRNFKNLWNPTKLSDLQSVSIFIDWISYTKELVSLSGVNFVAPENTANYSVSIMEPVRTNKLERYLSNSARSDIIIRYLFFRLLASQSSFIYDPSTNTKTSFIRLYPEEGLSYTIGKEPLPDPFESHAVDMGAVERSCAIQTLNYLQYSNARIFTELLYPTTDSRTIIRSETNKVMIAIRNAMQSMLDDLDWLDSSSRDGARNKIENLQINIAYPDFILNNTALDQYYSTLAFDKNDNYFSMLKKLTVFNRYQMFVNLTQATRNRNDFLGPPGTVNAWYQPELNSITIPEGILQQPYFDPAWPASIKFGALGVILGHELGHAFDDEGVQWTGSGQLQQWMSNTSYASFLKMAQCVVTEYSEFKPLNDSYNPNHLNGVNTQGENIADNGGIHSGWRSYRKWIALNGPDPQLPNRIFGQFTHDQLFFLSFAQIWCQLPPTPDAIYHQILTDPHSPSLYRVFGTIQNFPAFRTSFNCPINSTYAPATHCHVWVP